MHIITDGHRNAYYNNEPEAESRPLERAALNFRCEVVVVASHRNVNARRQAEFCLPKQEICIPAATEAAVVFPLLLVLLLLLLLHPQQLAS